ncbi:hypothetical protein [Gayadomonas joobiniege]|uniref:hypothetical protein n=1 Tax=Gayadomonas joobiniege TaxID=1234606 RepID=UPI00036E4852|nr:hypothetical protein [Gayadomonas joobiniege]
MVDDSFYKSARTQMKRPNIGDTMSLPSPTGKGVYQFRLVKISSEDVTKVIKKSPFNRRSAEHLTKAAVNDILPSIQEMKRNIEPAKAIGSKDKMTLLEGMRRSYAVSLVPGANFYVWLTDNISSEDEKILVKSADEYQKPTTVDLALSIRAMQIQDNSASLSVRQLADHFGVSTGTAQNAISITKIPEPVFKLFPAIKYISIRFLLSLINISEQKLINVAQQIKSELTDIDLNDEGSCQKEANRIQARFKKVLQQLDEPNEPVEKTEQEIAWLSMNKKGVKTKVKPDGTLVLELAKNQQKLSAQLLKILKS